MEITRTMDDLDLLYDFFRDNNAAAAAYATFACRVKDDKIEKLFRTYSVLTLAASKDTADLIISLGGKIY